MKKCHHCGDWFRPKFSTAKLCFPCWRKREQALAEYDSLQSEISLLKSMIERRETSIPPEVLNKLIRLCHPDRHGGSKLANETTVWLLEQRSKS
jgi:hypothetical protein